MESQQRHNAIETLWEGGEASAGVNGYTARKGAEPHPPTPPPGPGGQAPPIMIVQLVSIHAAKNK